MFNPDFTAQKCFFGAVKITKDADNSKYKYSGYGICFDSGSDFSFNEEDGTTSKGKIYWE